MKETIVENVGCEVGAIWGDHLSLVPEVGFCLFSGFYYPFVESVLWSIVAVV